MFRTNKSPGIWTVALLLWAAPLTAQVVLGAGAGQESWAGALPGAHAGRSLDVGEVGAGDLRRDLIVGAPDTASGRGSVYVIFGASARSSALSLSTASVIIDGGAAGDLFGTATAAGYVLTSEHAAVLVQRDLLVSAPGAYGGRGAVYLFRGGFANGSRLTVNDAVFRVIGAPGDGLGSALATADLDNDGYRELVIGAKNTGKVYVIPGGPALTGTYDIAAGSPITITGPGIGGALAAGDMTGDVVYDLAIGAPTAAGGSGQVYVIIGGTLPTSRALPAGADAQFTGTTPNAAAGTSVLISQIDQDGFGDLVIGAPGADGAGGARAGSGIVYLVWGSRAPRPVLTADAVISGANAGDHAGTTLASADINRQFPFDLLIGAPGGSAGGDIYAYYGRTRAGIPATIDLATQANRHVIGDVTAGPIEKIALFDVTGEGAEDVAAGVPTANSLGGAQAGQVFIAYSPRLSLSSSSIALTATQGGSVTATFNVLNTGGDVLEWSGRNNSSWISLAPTSGSASASSPNTVTLTASAVGLAPGTYHGSITVGSRTFDLDMTSSIPVDLTVLAPPGGGTPPPPPPSNVFGLPIPPDQGSPDGVTTPAGTQVAVLPVNDVMVVFSNVITAGKTAIQVTSNGADQTGLTLRAGPWTYRVSTTAVFSGPVTVAVAYDASLVGWEGAERLLITGRDSTSRLDVKRHIVFGSTSTLPVSVWPAEDLTRYTVSRGALVNYIGSSWETGWQIFPMKLDPDAAADLFMYNPATGAWRQGINNGSGAFSYQLLGWSPGWRVYPAELNGDGYGDVFLYNVQTGTWYQCLNDRQGGFTYRGGAWSSGWSITPGDFNGDGLTDFFLYNAQTGVWYKAIMRSDGSFRYAGGSWDPGWSMYPADLNGDHKTDMFLYKPATGQWVEAFSTATDAFAYVGGSWSANWTITVADLDGDGRQDVFVYNQSTGVWYQCFSQASGGFTYAGGAWDPGWRITPADFNGDGRADFLITKPATGAWFQARNVGPGTYSYLGGYWDPNWQTFVADLSGDGKDDVFLYRADTGRFFDVITK